jgi:hypothetical protein
MLTSMVRIFALQIEEVGAAGVRRKGAVVLRHGDHVAVLGDRPEAASVGVAVPQHGGFGTQPLEGVVRHAVHETIEVAQVDVGDAHRDFS